MSFVIYPRHIGVNPTRIKKFKDKVRRLTPRNHGKNVEQQIAELSRFLRGWINYFRIANIKGFLEETISWMDPQKTTDETDAGVEKVDRTT